MLGTEHHNNATFYFYLYVVNVYNEIEYTKVGKKVENATFRTDSEKECQCPNSLIGKERFFLIYLQHT